MSAKIISFSPKNVSSKEREKIIQEYLPIVKIIAKKVFQRLPANYELDDLISCGVMGLMDAIEKYDHEQGVKFKTYAEYRIKGQILDELRSLDWASRATRDKIKNFEKVEGQLNHQLGRKATGNEVCKVLKCEIKEYHQLLQRIQPVQTVSLTPTEGSSNVISLHKAFADQKIQNNPHQMIEEGNLRDFVKAKINTLSEKEGVVLKMYYYEQKTMKEISEILNVTESRVSQLHQISMKKLRKKVSSEAA